MYKNLFFILSLFTGLIFISCKKSAVESPEPPVKAYKLSYGDSILYLKSGNDVIVNPVQYKEGTYTAFPEGIEIDKASGAINVTKSETGLRYKITHTTAGGETNETTVLLSGINYTDNYHTMSRGDSLSVPLYNAGQPMPSASFDVDNTARSSGLAIDPVTGVINVAKSTRNGIFGLPPGNHVQKEFNVKYRINDKSGNTVNTIKVLLYWYHRMSDVPADLRQLLIDRQPMFLRGAYPEATTRAAAKPRPPCLVIVGQ